MQSKFEVNPFDRSAITDYRQIAGRSDELRQIRFILRNSSKVRNRIKSIILGGDRGVGKTSLLNLIESECLINNVLPIRIDLTEVSASNVNEFFWHLFSQTLNTVFNLNILGGKNGDVDLAVQKILNNDGIEDPANWVFQTPLQRKKYLVNCNINFEFHLLIEDLKTFRKELSKSGKYNEKLKLLFLVDEAQLIYSKIPIIEALRFIIQSHELGCGFVFAGDKSYESSNWEKVFGGSYREFEIINLHYFNSVDEVSDFFRKSLETIGWSEDDIEKNLFYRFHLTCRHIFQLTSGKPAWITIVASKMFERCMQGEAKQLRFDKLAQLSVKQLLESSSEIDTQIVHYIENLPINRQKWLAEFFACQLNSLKNIYIYSSLKFSGDLDMPLKNFIEFAKELIDKKIITLIKKSNTTEEGGLDDDKFLEFRFYAFEFKSDTLQHWLQISTEGRFRFDLAPTGIRLMEFINEQLVSEKCNPSILDNHDRSQEESAKLSNVMKAIANKTYDLSQDSYRYCSMLYKFCKRIETSQQKEVLHVELFDLKSEKKEVWDIYNYNEKMKIVPFRFSPSTFSKLTSNVERFRAFDSLYKLSLSIEKIGDSNFKHLQRLIIASGDAKKIGIVIRDQMEELVRSYIKDSNIELSYEKAKFFLQLFNDGHDLKISDLNNSAYVFLEKEELENAKILLSEARTKIYWDAMNDDDVVSAVLVLYNSAIVAIKEFRYEEAKKDLFEAKSLYGDRALNDDVGALKVLIFDDTINQLKIKEIKHQTSDHQVINCRKYIDENLENIEKFEQQSGEK